LPSVRVTTDGRADVHGGLLTTTGDTWYIVVDSSRVVGVPSARVIRSRINAEGDAPSSVFGDLFGSEPLD
jgi:hypothetical protein